MRGESGQVLRGMVGWQTVWRAFELPLIFGGSKGAECNSAIQRRALWAYASARNQNALWMR
jgi:hypothetical protein